MNKLLGFLNIVALVITLIMNGLSQSDFFPTPIGELGQSRAVFFLPSAYVFAIWGVIYLGLIAFAFYQARHETIRQRVSWYFVLSCAANSIWLVFFLYNRIWESTVAMLVLLFALLMIYTRLQIGVAKVSTQEKWFVHIPFSIYLGWISVATIANFSAALFDAGFVLSFLGISADIWAVIMMSIAGILGISFIVLRHDYAYALVIVWALIGIFARPFDTPAFDVLNQLNVALVHNAALSIAIVLALALGLSAIRELIGRESTNNTKIRAT
jgi:benzodiazapine receptor